LQLRPGDQVDVRLEFLTRGKQSKVGSKLVVESNDPQRPVVEFKVSGFVKRVMTWEPRGGLVIRSVGGEAGLVGRVHLKNQMKDPLKLQIIADAVPHVDFEFKEIEAGRVYDLIGRTNRPLSPGTFRGSLGLATGLTREPRVLMPVRVQILSVVNPVPGAIYLPSTSDQPTRRWVTINYYGKEKFRVTGAHCEHEGVQATIGAAAPPRGGMARVKPTPTALVRARVTLPRAGEIPREGLRIEFRTNDPQHPTCEVLVTTDRAAYDRVMYGDQVGAGASGGRSR